MATTCFQNRPSLLLCIVELLSNKDARARSYNIKAAKATRIGECAQLNKLSDFKNEELKETHYMKWLTNIVATSHDLCKQAHGELSRELLQSAEDNSNVLADALLGLSVVQPDQHNSFWTICGIKQSGVEFDEEKQVDLQLCKREAILCMLSLAESDNLLALAEEEPDETPKEKKLQAKAKQQLQEERENTTDFRVSDRQKRKFSSISMKNESEESIMPSSSSSVSYSRPIDVYFQQMGAQQAAGEREKKLQDLWNRLQSKVTYLTAEYATEVLELFSDKGLINAEDLESLGVQEIDNIEKKLKDCPRTLFLRALRPSKKEI